MCAAALMYAMYFLFISVCALPMAFMYAPGSVDTSCAKIVALNNVRRRRDNKCFIVFLFVWCFILSLITLRRMQYLHKGQHVKIHPILHSDLSVVHQPASVVFQ